MPRCWRVRSLLSSYTAGELSAHAAEAVARHLKDCPACMAEYREYKEARDALLSCAKRSVPEGAWDGLWESVRDGMRARTESRAKPLPPPRYAKTLWRVAAVAAAASICVAALLLTHLQKTPPDVESETPAVQQVAEKPVSVPDEPEKQPPASPERETILARGQLNNHADGYGITAVRLASSDESNFAY